MGMKHGTLDETNVDSRQTDELIRLIREALGVSAAVQAAPAGSGDDIELRLPGGQVLRLQVKQADAPAGPGGGAESTVYVLRRATRRLHDEWRRAGRSFVDLSGTVHLAFPNLLVDRANVRPPAIRGAVHRSFDPFSDRGSLIARTLHEAVSDERAWGVRELAAAAGVSPATATRVVRELERHGVEVQRRGRNASVRLVDAGALISAWTRAYDWTRNAGVAFNAPVGDPARFLVRLGRAWSGPRWALTLHAGAARLAPISTWTRAHLYVDAADLQALVELGRAQGWEPAEGGNVVLLKPWYRTSVWHGLQQVQGLPVVSPLQLALDLWHYPLRGREQAEHLLEAVMPGRSA